MDRIELLQRAMMAHVHGDYLRPSEVACALGISASGVGSMVKRGELPIIRRGSRILFAVEAVLAYVNKTGAEIVDTEPPCVLAGAFRDQMFHDQPNGGLELGGVFDLDGATMIVQGFEFGKWVRMHPVDSPDAICVTQDWGMWLAQAERRGAHIVAIDPDDEVML